MADLATVARPYARALYALAKERNKLQPWLEDLEVIAKVSVDDKVEQAISAPDRSAQEKGALFLELVASMKLDEEIKKFISVLAENQRLLSLQAIYEQYREMTLSEQKTQEAILYSAYPLSGKELEEVRLRLEKKLGTGLEVRVEVDPELIGGIKVEFGDRVLDMSVQGKLNALYAAMVN